MPAKQALKGEAVMGDTQRLNDTQQLEILALLGAASTERSAMRAARALAELMRHLHALAERIALSCPTRITATSRETWCATTPPTQARTKAWHHIPLAP
jgi:hypothetical protein